MSGKWIAQLALPPEVVRWEWKRYRRAFVYIATEVICRSRQRWLRFSPAHRFLGPLIDAHVQRGPLMSRSREFRYTISQPLLGERLFQD